MRNYRNTGKPRLRRTLALTMSAVLLLGSLPVSAVDDGVKPTYDEAYYAMTDYYGNLTDGSVVKSYTMNGTDALTDYGTYDEVVNLTNGLTPTTKDGKTIFNFEKDSIPEHFYFEGKTAKPFEQLPWTLSVHYTLNGVAAKAENLAGKTGIVEINVDAIPNESASEYARNNYTLEAMAIFNQDDILSLEAPGAQVQLVGNLRAVLFIGLPGEECHFTIRVGSNDFSFGGMTFLMVPATLSQLQEISDLAQRKDDLEDNYNKLSDSLDVLLDSMNGISSSLNATANGLDQLNTSRETISNGKADLYNKADIVLDDLDAINAALEPVSGEIDDASNAISDSKVELAKLTEKATSLRSDLKDLSSLIDDIQDHKDDFDAIFDRLTTLRSELRDLESALNDAKKTEIPSISPLFNGMNETQLKAALTQAQGLHTAYAAANGNSPLDFEQFITAALIAKGNSSAAATAAQLVTVYNAYGSKEEAYAAAYDAAIAMGADEDTANAKGTEAATAWATASQMHSAFTIAGGSGSTPLDFDGFLYAALLVNGTENAKTSADSLYKLWRLNEEDSGLTAIIMMESQDLNEKVANLNDVIDTTNQLLKDISGPTADLAGTLADLCSDLDELDDLVSTADDFGDLGKSVSKKCIAILDEVDALYKILDTYEPKLQQSLTTAKSLSETARKTVSDTSNFLGSFEDLAQTAGTQLDAGTKQTLEGLAAALRATANSLNTTNDVKSAKDNISDIIEETWDDYTGDVNNLLLMDANAEAISLTDERNSAPTSIQVLIRTQEIKQDSGETTDITVAQAEQTTFWGRVAQMFKDFWAAITGIFKGKD